MRLFKIGKALGEGESYLTLEKNFPLGIKQQSLTHSQTVLFDQYGFLCNIYTTVFRVKRKRSVRLFKCLSPKSVV